MAVETTPRVEYRRFTVDEYHKMAEAGILHEDDPVELIDGEIVQMSAAGGRHIAAVSELTRLVQGALGDDLRLLVQSPIRMGPHAEPEQDLAVVPVKALGENPPDAADVLLAIEVSDTSLAYDRARKLPAYAKAGITESWLADIQGDALERHTDPVDGEYRTMLRVGRGRQTESTVLPGLVLKVDEVLG